MTDDKKIEIVAILAGQFYVVALQKMKAPPSYDVAESTIRDFAVQATYALQYSAKALEQAGMLSANTVPEDGGLVRCNDLRENL